MPPATPTFTYRLAFRPVDDQMSSAELARTVQHALLSLSGKTNRISALTLQRPPLEDANGLYMIASAAGPEHWYLDLDDELLSLGLRSELHP